MNLDPANALKVARLYVKNKYKASSDPSDFHYIVIGTDPVAEQLYAEEHTLCANDKEAHKIELKDEEYLIKVYKHNWATSVLRSGFGNLATTSF